MWFANNKNFKVSLNLASRGPLEEGRQPVRRPATFEDRDSHDDEEEYDEDAPRPEPQAPAVQPGGAQNAVSATGGLIAHGQTCEAIPGGIRTDAREALRSSLSLRLREWIGTSRTRQSGWFTVQCSLTSGCHCL